jgi:hypothetical protein
MKANIFKDFSINSDNPEKHFDDIPCMNNEPNMSYQEGRFKELQDIHTLGLSDANFFDKDLQETRNSND